MKFIKTKTFTNSWGREETRFDGLTKTGIAVVTTPIILLWFFIFCVRFVGAGEVGIITRFGDVNRVGESGVSLKLPWPFESMHKMEIRVQKEEQDVSAATKDLQDVSTKLAINYALDNETALRVFKELGGDYRKRVVEPAVQESFKAATAEYTAQELITDRPSVKAKAYEAIKERLNKYGIRVVDLNIVDFKFSAAFNQAIEAVQVANQQVAQAKQELETTKVNAEKTIAQANAQAEAQRVQQQTLTDELLQKYAIDKWNGVLPTTNAGEIPFIIR